MYVRSLTAKIRWVLAFLKSGHRTAENVLEKALQQEEFTYFAEKNQAPVSCTPAAVQRVVLFCRRIGLVDGNHRVTREGRRVANVTRDEDQFLRSLGEFAKGHIVDATERAVGFVQLRLAIKQIWKARGATLPRPREIQAMLEKGSNRSFDEDTFSKILNVLSACHVLVKYRRPIYLVPRTVETEKIERIDGE